MDLDQLTLEVDGVTRSFAEWTSDFVDGYYPSVGRDCYRVPALHFNQQKLTSMSSDGPDEKLVLNPSDLSLTIGDLAHTLVLENLEELSEQLRAAGEGPLFIISTVHYDNYLDKLPRTRPKAKRKKKKSTGQADVLGVSVSERSEGHPCSSGNLEENVQVGEDEGKQLLPPRPANRGGKRGEIDILLLHKQGGVILIEVKSTGYTDGSWTPSEEKLQVCIRERVQRAEQQLTGGADVLRYIMPDLTLPHITMVVALPYVTRQQLSQAVSTESVDPNLRFLCQDDLRPSIMASPLSTQTAEGSAGYSSHHVHVSGMLDWWHNTACAGLTQLLSLHSMRTMVGRVCGLMSVVSVWTTSKPRVEVRTMAQAISETGRRLSDIVLLPSQADLLAQPSLQRLWLTGPMGSGKTIMLQLKGRQWLMEGKRVIVINIRAISRGRPHGHVLEEGIRRAAQNQSGTGSVERYDIALKEVKFETLLTNIAAGGSTENACFVVDEVISCVTFIAQKLVQHFPDCPVWCVAPYVTPVPSTFQPYRLGAVLRNPPSVQLMLKELDLNPRHRHAYTTRSAARGLPCDGPPIIFIEHSKHNTHVRHLDCSQCADELADIFETKLGLQLHPPATDETGHFPTKVGAAHPKSNESKKHQMTFEAVPLSFRDVLILISVPYSVYKHVADYHWEVSIPETLQYLMYMGTSRFVWGLIQRGVPIRVAFDHTLKEIAFPPEDEVIMTDVTGVHSLERKVVVFLRGGPPLTQEEIAENVSRYQFVQAGCHPGQQPQPASQTKLSSNQQPLKTPPENETDNNQLLLLASAVHEVRDFLYPQLPTFFSPCPDEAKVIVNRLFGNMMVAATQHIVGNSDQKQGFHTQQTSSPPLPVSELRAGMEIREDLPMLPGQGDTADAAPAVQRDDEGGEYVTELDSVFLVPGLKEEGDEGERQSELRRIQQAMAMLSEDDLDWDFLAATRCLSQYISILP